jgi:serine O-acetyltransferase
MKIFGNTAAIAAVDPVWTTIREEAEEMARAEPLVASLAHAVILHHDTLEDALSFRLAQKLGHSDLPEMVLREVAGKAFDADPEIGAAARADIVAVRERDPACHRYVEPVLFFKGFQALLAHRVAHWLWREGRRDLAKYLQMRMSEVFTVDIHPGARIGRGIMIDHAHGIVIGETAVVGDDVSMLHSVTLGGTGKEDGDRHPKIGDGVLIGAGAKILGNITVGKCSRIAAGSVVLQAVPSCKTVAGVPARIVGDAGCSTPSRSMDHRVQRARHVDDIVPDC